MKGKEVASQRKDLEANTLAIVPAYQGMVEDGAGSAPYLSADMVQAIGTRFLKMQLEVVSQATLLASDDE